MPGCCPRARFTLAASSRPPAPSSAMTSRRFVSSMRDSPTRFERCRPAGQAIFCTFSLPQMSRQVLGTDLNCLESEGAAALPRPAQPPTRFLDLPRGYRRQPLATCEGYPASPRIRLTLVEIALD